MIKTELTAVECQDLARSFSKPWYRHYSASKLKTDPLYRGVAGALKAGDPTLPLLDIGCGIGLLAFYLRRCGMNAPVHGVDYDRCPEAEGWDHRLSTLRPPRDKEG
ncbi:MAG: class I SAM-dependent methyltransferase, partial [Verrucomicrobiota bacterium]